MTDVPNEFRLGWRVVLAAMFGVGVGIIGAPIFTLGTLIVPLSAAFHWSRSQVSIASLCMVFGTILTAMFVGKVVDRFGARVIGIVSLVTLILAYLGMTQITSNIYTFYFGLVVLSLAACGTSPIIWTRTVALWFEKSRGLAFGLTLMGTGIAAIVMPPFVGRLIAAHDWRAGYLGLAGATAVALVPVILFFREPRSQELRPCVVAVSPLPPIVGFTLREALHSRQFWQLAIVNFVVTSATASLIVHLVPLLTDSGIVRSTAAAIAALMGVTIIIGRFSTGYLMDRLHPPYVGSAFLLAAGLGVILLESTLPRLLGTSLAAAVFGLAAGAEVQLVAYITSRYFGLRSYGKIYAVQFIIFELAVGFGPAVTGHTFDVYGSYLVALNACLGAFFGGGALLAVLGTPVALKNAI